MILRLNSRQSSTSFSGAALACVLTMLTACVSPRPTVVLTPSEPSVQAKAYAHYLNGLAYLRDSDKEGALTEFEEVLRLDPSASRAATTLATLYRIEKRHDDALAVLERAVDTGSRAPTVHIMLASLYRAAKRHNDALAVLEKAAGTGIENINLLMVLASLYQQLGRHDDAERTLRRATDASPSNAAPYVYLGDLFAKNNDLVAAVDAYMEAAGLQPKSALVRQKLGQVYTLMRRPDKAVVELKLAGDLDPGVSDRNAYNLGLVLIETGDIEAAEQPLLIALGREPRDVRVRRSLAGLYCQMKRWDDADKQYEAIEKLSPDNERFAQERAAARFLAGRYARVIKTLDPFGGGLSDDLFTRFLNAGAEWKLGRKEAALARINGLATVRDHGPLDAILSTVTLFGKQQAADTFSTLIDELVGEGASSETLHILNGRLLEAIDRKEDALAAMVKATEINPRSKLGHFFAGAINEEMDRHDESVVHFEQALEIDPDDPELNNHLGYTYADQNIHIDEAHGMLTKALEAEPDNGYFLDSMGWVFYRKGQLERALEYIRRALPNMSTDDAIVRDHLGDVLLDLGRVDEALVEWRKAVILDPTMETAREKIKKHTSAKK